MASSIIRFQQPNRRTSLLMKSYFSLVNNYHYFLTDHIMIWRESKGHLGMVLAERDVIRHFIMQFCYSNMLMGKTVDEVSCWL